MAVYTITDIEKLTGIRAHTLRAWEQRHGLITPRRDAANARYYLDEDLRELSVIALLNKHGHRISKIASMCSGERTSLVAAISCIPIGAARQLDTLSLAVVEMDEYRISLLLDTNIEQRGFEETMLKLVYPFLDKLGVLYFTGAVTAVQEAFVGALLRRKILAATDRLDHETRADADAPTFALYLPEGERQEQGILFVQYLLKKRGIRTVYLGPDTSPADLADACAATRIDYLFTLLSTTYVARPIEQMVEETLERCAEVTLVLTGYQTTLHDLSQHERVTTVTGLGDLLDFVADLSKIEDLSIVAG